MGEKDFKKKIEIILEQLKEFRKGKYVRFI